MEKTLVVMAAGMASRYGGGKQVDGLGPNGEILLEYSVADALRAGFTRVVLIIREDMKETVDRICGDKIAQKCRLDYAYQDYTRLPEWFTVPEGRVKPYGTVHAVLCARNVVETPFAVLNADDFYGYDAFRIMSEELDKGGTAMVGYPVGNTLSMNGAVTRALCETEDGFLTRIVELKEISRAESGEVVSGDKVIDGNAPVSMNFFGFADYKDAFDRMETYFNAFLREKGQEMKSECLLPDFVGHEIAGDMKMRVPRTNAHWFGMTYREDRESVAAALKKLHDAGEYA